MTEPVKKKRSKVKWHIVALTVAAALAGALADTGLIPGQFADVLFGVVDAAAPPPVT